MKKCPFGNGTCTDECALFISGDDLNELVRNRLKAIGVFYDQDGGTCSLKADALAHYRNIFENTTVYNKR